MVNPSIEVAQTIDGVPSSDYRSYETMTLMGRKHGV
jgi:hypothetical protein